jgi:ectoine hydroxylase-related dioxygenase (phytanoyl-CoA dioxygenase family)
MTMTDRLSDDAILKALDTEGYVIVPQLLSAETVRQLRSDLEKAIEREDAYHGGTDHPDQGMVLVCCTHARSFVDLLANDELMRPITHVLGEGCILYAYTSSSLPPGRSNYSQRIHVDCPRLIPGYATNAGAMILLDDFTLANGATWVLPGSHRQREAPSEEYFFANAKRVVAVAGSVCYLDPRIWHAGGKNETDRWRHSITFNMCRPYMKQRLDIPKMMRGQDLEGVSEKALQKMGFFAQVPESLDEYYQPPEKRKFRQKPE